MGEPPGMRPISAWERKFVGYTLAGDLTELRLKVLPQTRAELMGAWRECVKSASPNRDMDALKQARDRVLETIERGVTNDDPRVNLPSDTTCKMCKGTGRIATSFGRQCPSCNGTGQRQ